MTSLRTVWTPLAWVACVVLGGCGITIPGNLDLDIDPSVTGAAGGGGSRPPAGGTVASVAGSWSGGASGTSPGTAGSWGGYAGSVAAGSWGGYAGTGAAGYWGGAAGAGVAGGWGGYAGGVAPYYPVDHDNDGWNEYSDCDDFNALVHPGMMEWCCDGIDSDCDGRDAPPGGAACICEHDGGRDWDGDGYTSSQGDCDDSNWQVHPGQLESCDDGIDNDCNGWVDSQDRCFSSDSDRDGYSDSLDCDPWNANVNQGVGEICGDGIDNNCDGIVDGYPYCDSQPIDWDRDGYPYEKDCNDGDSSVFPGSPYEQCCDGIDSNCDGSDGLYDGICTCPTPGDRDGDGYGYGIGMSDPSLADCNDQDATVHPNAYEECGDKRDNNCNGFIDLADPGCKLTIID